MIPSICVMEALLVIERKGGDAVRFGRTLKERINQVKRDRSSPSAALLLSSLEAADRALEARIDEVGQRLAVVLFTLTRQARLISIEPSMIYRSLVDNPIANAPTDALILGCVINDINQIRAASDGKPDLEFALLSVNSRDFSRPHMFTQMSEANIKYFRNLDRCLDWLASPSSG